MCGETNEGRTRSHLVQTLLQHGPGDGDRSLGEIEARVDGAEQSEGIERMCDQGSVPGRRRAGGREGGRE